MKSFEDWVLEAPCDSSVYRWKNQLVALGANWDSFRCDAATGGESLLVDDLVDGGIPRLAARDIVAAVQEALAQSQWPLAVFWDLDDLLVSSSSDGRSVGTTLKALLSSYGTMVQFRAYAQSGSHQTLPEWSSELLSVGRQLVDAPQDIVQAMMVADAMEFAFTHPDGATLCLMFGDRDYSHLLSKLQPPQWRTVIVRPQAEIDRAINTRCTATVSWERDVLQLPSAEPIGASASDPTSQAMSQTASRTRATGLWIRRSGANG